LKDIHAGEIGHLKEYFSAAAQCLMVGAIRYYPKESSVPQRYVLLWKGLSVVA
jgi:hypothetical protein